MAEALESKFVTVEGVRLHYQETGKGYPVICIHGAGPGASAESNFKLNVGALSEKFRVVLWDMPQYGKSAKVVLTEPRLKFNARILNGFMSAIGLDRAHIVGNSMGGQVGLKLGLDFPERLTRIVIIGSTPMPPIFAPFPVEGIKLIARYYKGNGPSREKLRELLQTIVYDASFLTEETFEERYQASIDPEVVELFGKRQGEIPRENLGPELPRLKAKFLAVWGMDDRFGALDVGLQMTRIIPDARMHIFTKCGHWAQVEHAAEFNRIVLDFLLN
ncbi:MAG TPA: alpha/beta hydrolase [Stellaceae bacterium]|nr:alpha/beta hydrolase [Stellaceae bacterium]